MAEVLKKNTCGQWTLLKAKAAVRGESVNLEEKEVKLPLKPGIKGKDSTLTGKVEKNVNNSYSVSPNSMSGGMEMSEFSKNGQWKLSPGKKALPAMPPELEAHEGIIEEKHPHHALAMNHIKALMDAGHHGEARRLHEKWTGQKTYSKS